MATHRAGVVGRLLHRRQNLIQRQLEGNGSHERTHCSSSFGGVRSGLGKELSEGGEGGEV